MDSILNHAIQWIVFQCVCRQLAGTADMTIVPSRMRAEWWRAMALITIAVGGRGQAFYLKRLGYFHELRQLGMLHIHHTLVHELQQFRHHGLRYVFENDCKGKRRQNEYRLLLYLFCRLLKHVEISTDIFIYNILLCLIQYNIINLSDTFWDAHWTEFIFWSKILISISEVLLQKWPMHNWRQFIYHNNVQVSFNFYNELTDNK